MPSYVAPPEEDGYVAHACMIVAHMAASFHGVLEVLLAREVGGDCGGVKFRGHDILQFEHLKGVPSKTPDSVLACTACGAMFYRECQKEGLRSACNGKTKGLAYTCNLLDRRLCPDPAGDWKFDELEAVSSSRLHEFCSSLALLAMFRR